MGHPRPRAARVVIPVDPLVVVRTLRGATRRDLAVLDTHERERARRFVFDRDRDRYVAAHAWMRRVLAEIVDGRPADLVIEPDGDGKPALAGGPAFSLSHSGDVAALAIAPAAVGVDVEHVPDEVDRAAAALVLGPGELAVADRDGPLAFTRAWTRKEAWVKATGQGLHDGLRTVDLDGDRTPDGLWIRTFPPMGGRRRRPDLVVSLVAGVPVAEAVLDPGDLVVAS